MWIKKMFWEGFSVAELNILQINAIRKKQNL